MKTVLTECLYCGGPFEAVPAEIRRGNGKFCSRGCAATHRNKGRKSSGKKFLTYAEKKDAYGGGFANGQAICRIQGRARKKGIPCELTHVIFQRMWSEQKGKCFYTQRPMTVGQSTRKYFDMDQVSVDRVVPAKGYIIGNMVLCCRWVNVAKMQGTLSDLVERAKELLRGRT